MILSPYDPVPKTALQITNIQIIVEANLHANRIAVLEVCARERILFQLAKLSRWGAFLFANDSGKQVHKKRVSPVEATNSTEAPPRYIVVLKIGGNELDDEAFIFGLVKAVKAVQEEGHFPVIVHGGGKAVTDYGKKLGLEEKRIDGLRITDNATLDLSEMVLSGLMNKRLVRALVHADIRAAGISGVDDGTIYVEKMWHPGGDLGRVGEVTDVDPYLLNTLIAANIVPVVSPISFGSLDASAAGNDSANQVYWYR